MRKKDFASLRSRFRRKLVEKNYASALRILDDMISVSKDAYAGDPLYLELLKGALLYLLGDMEGSKSVFSEAYSKFPSLGGQDIGSSSRKIMDRLFGEGFSERGSADAVIEVLPELKDVSGEALKCLMDLSKIKTYRKGEYICKESEAAEALFVVLKGEASLVRGGTRIGHIRRGDVIGWMTLFGFGGVCSADVIAVTDVEVLRVPYDALKDPSRSPSDVFDELKSLFQKRVRESAVLSSGLFRDLPLRMRGSILESSQLVQFSQGSELSGDSLSNFLYVVADGVVSLVFPSGNSVDLSKGDAFGGPSLKGGKAIFLKDSCLVKMPWSKLGEIGEPVSDKVVELEGSGVYRGSQEDVS